MKHDIKSELSVPDYYRKLGGEILTLDTVATKGMTQEHRQLLCKQHFEYADKVEQEEKEALKMYKKRSYNRKRK
jgi:hypothetical protein